MPKKKLKNNQKRVESIKGPAINAPLCEDSSKFIKWAAEHIWITTAAFFVFSFVVRLVISFLTAPLAATITPDEVRYFHIARSIAEQGRILVRDMPTTSQKILYPLFLTPAFFLSEDQFVQMNIIRVINCLVMSSSVFPAALLAKKMTANKIIIILTLAFTIFLPDMVFSSMLMSEVLYLPMVMWLLYVAHCAMSEYDKHKRLLLFAVLGVVAYLTYLTKEIGASFLISCALILVFEAIRNRKIAVRNITSALCCSLIFFIMFFIMKLTVFNGAGNSYVGPGGDQLTLTALNGAYTWYYLFYSTVILLVVVIMSFYVLPVFFPLIAFRDMDNENRRMYIFTILTLFVMVGTVAYTISIREDLGYITPSFHVRYFSPLGIPLAILCFEFMLQNKKDNSNELKERFSPAFYILITLFCAALIFLMQRGPAMDGFVDHMSLKSLFSLEQLNTTMGAGDHEVNFAWMAFKFLLLLLTIIGVWLLYQGKRKSIFIMLLSLMLIVGTFDNLYGYRSIRCIQSYHYYSIIASENPETDITEESILFTKSIQLSRRAGEAMVAVNSYLRGVDGPVMAYLPSAAVFYADTYLSASIFPADYEELTEFAAFSNGVVELGKYGISESKGYYSTADRGFLSFDYIIVFMDDNPFENVSVVYEQYPFLVLHNNDPSRLYMRTSPASH